MHSFFPLDLFPAVVPGDCEAPLACQYQTDRCHVLLQLHIKERTHIPNHTRALHAHCRGAAARGRDQ